MGICSTRQNSCPVLILVRITTALLKHHAREQPQWKGFIWLTYPESQSNEGSQGRNSNQVGISGGWVMQRPWRSANYWLAPHALLGLLSCRTQDDQLCLGCTTHSGLDPPTSIMNLKNVPQACLQPLLKEAFFPIEAPSSLTYTCIKLT